jgi:hypothetical protein
VCEKSTRETNHIGNVTRASGVAPLNPVARHDGHLMLHEYRLIPAGDERVRANPARVGGAES